MRLRRDEGEEAAGARRDAHKSWGAPIAECIAALAVSSAIGCAHKQERLYEPPKGSIAVYSLEDGIRPERVAIGNDINVIAHADVRIMRGGRQVSLRDLESGTDGIALTFCWFMFQDIGVGPDDNPTWFLLNPRYSEPGEPRYIGAAVFRVDAKGNDYALVVPVRHDDTALMDAGWSLQAAVKSRSDFLFRLRPGSLIPLLDAHAIYRMPDYCRETALPEIAVVEFGRTIPMLAVYPDRR